MEEIMAHQNRALIAAAMFVVLTIAAGTAAAGTTNVTKPVPIKRVNPLYPNTLVAAKVEGDVRLEAIVDVKGNVKDVKLLTGASQNEALAESAIEALRQWKFEAAKADGKPVEAKFEPTI